MNVVEDTQLSDAFDNNDLMSFTPVASLVHERLGMEGNDTLNKGNTASLRLRTQDSNGLSSQPPQKRARHSDELKNIAFDTMDSQSENNMDSACDYQNQSESSFANVDESVEKVGTHEFEIIDEVAADEEELEEEVEQDSDESLDDTELYALLEEGITKDSISHSERPIEREKVVLVGMYT